MQLIKQKIFCDAHCYLLETWRRECYRAAGLLHVEFAQGDVEELLG